VYMIRIYQRTMHNRVGAGVDVESRDLTRWELAPIAALVAVIVALGVYPNFVAKKSDDAASASAYRPALVACTGISPRNVAAGHFPIGDPQCGGGDRATAEASP
jgi:formate hydrogenlyase subunit 3/multisubunit Na+/H+ antiporter MnhD subunit